MSLHPDSAYLTTATNSKFFYATPYRSGVSYNNTWTTGSDGTIYTTISVPGLVFGTPLNVTTQLRAGTTQTVTDAVNCWIVGARAITDAIVVWIYAGGGGTNGAPVDNTDYGLSWFASQSA